MTPDLPRLAFVHIPKTAGMSVSEFFRGMYDERLMFRPRGKAPRAEDYDTTPDDAFHSFRYFSGHMFRRNYVRLPGDTRMFTIVREPVAAAVSLYRFWQRLPSQYVDHGSRAAYEKARTHSFRDWVLSAEKVFHFYMVRHFMDPSMIRGRIDLEACKEALEQELDGFLHVGTTENVALTMKVLCRKAGLDVAAEFPRKNASPKAEVVAQEDLRVLRQVLNERSPLAFWLYDYARKREARDFANYLTLTNDGTPRHH